MGTFLICQQKGTGLNMKMQAPAPVTRAWM